MAKKLKIEKWLLGQRGGGVLYSPCIEKIWDMGKASDNNGCSAYMTLHVCRIHEQCTQKWTFGFGECLTLTQNPIQHCYS